MIGRYSRRATLATALACCVTGRMWAQYPELRAGETVRVWPVGQANALTGIFTAFHGDSLYLADQAIAMPEIRQIDLARGSSVSRAHYATMIIVGGAVGALGGRLASANAVNNAESTQLGLYVGLGLGYLATKGLPRKPTWYTVLPVAPAPVLAARGQAITVEQFPDIKPGQLVKVWMDSNRVVEGRLRELIPSASAILVGESRDSIRLTSINALAVGQRQTASTALRVGGAMAGVFGLASFVGTYFLCGLAGENCGSSDYGPPVTKATAIGLGFGGLLGAAIGSKRTTWKTRFYR